MIQLLNLYLELRDLSPFITLILKNKKLTNILEIGKF